MRWIVKQRRYALGAFGMTLFLLVPLVLSGCGKEEPKASPAGYYEGPRTKGEGWYGKVRPGKVDVVTSP